MKKGFIAGVLLASMSLMLVGCSEDVIQVIEEEKQNRFKGSETVEYIEVIEDTETSCKYIYASKDWANASGLAITPLLKADGTVDCD